MNETYTKHLFMAYPTLYQNRRGGLMAEGFRCDDGWFEIIDDLSRKLTEIGDREGSSPIIAEYVKEKFGVLVFGVNRLDDEIRKVIHEAEDRSSRTCEITGSLGSLCQQGYLLKTLAPDVSERLGFEPASPNILEILGRGGPSHERG